jgi:hypothetical protein
MITNIYTFTWLLLQVPNGRAPYDIPQDSRQKAHELVMTEIMCADVIEECESDGKKRTVPVIVRSSCAALKKRQYRSNANFRACLDAVNMTGELKYFQSYTQEAVRCAWTKIRLLIESLYNGGYLCKQGNAGAVTRQAIQMLKYCEGRPGEQPIDFCYFLLANKTLWPLMTMPQDICKCTSFKSFSMIVSSNGFCTPFHQDAHDEQLVFSQFENWYGQNLVKRVYDMDEDGEILIDTQHMDNGDCVIFRVSE